jgi:hypothetical protein
MKWKVRLGACRIFPNCSDDPGQHQELCIESLISGMYHPLFGLIYGMPSPGDKRPVYERFLWQTIRATTYAKGNECVSTGFSADVGQLASTLVGEVGAGCRPAVSRSDVLSDWIEPNGMRKNVRTFPPFMISWCGAGASAGAVFDRLLQRAELRRARASDARRRYFAQHQQLNECPADKAEINAVSMACRTTVGSQR